MKSGWSIVIAVWVAVMIGSVYGKEPDVKTLSEKKVVMVIAFRDFRDEEFFKPFSALTDAGAEVRVASSQLGKAKGVLGKTVEVNALIGDIVVSQFDGVIFVGGTGAQEYFNSPVAHRLAQDAVLNKKVLGAICIAPATLANAGVLKGKKATCFSSVKPVLGKAGALIQNEPVVRDGAIITADGPQAAGGFGATLIEALKD